MERQLSLELKVLSSGKQKNSSLDKHLSSKKEKKPNQEKHKNLFVSRLLPKIKKETKLKSLSLEGVETEENTLKEAPPDVHSPKKEQLIDNLITVEELAVIFGLAPQTIRNWVAQRKLPYVRIGRRNFFQKRSLQRWLIQKEESQWE